jgi:hypothetical protein
MNNTLGIEYAYTRIHKLEVEALAYKDKIAELEKTEPLLQKVLDCCDGLHYEYTQANYGDAKNWLRHISDAYADYQDSIDLSKGGVKRAIEIILEKDERIAELEECLLEYVNATVRLWTGSNEVELLEEKATLLLSKGGEE